MASCRCSCVRGLGPPGGWWRGAWVFGPPMWSWAVTWCLASATLLHSSAVISSSRSLLQPGSCSRSRAIYTDPWGTISDGPNNYNYTEDTYCEWLIKSNTSNRFINIDFKAMATECSFDFVYVFDGDNIESRLIGSFSGQTLPPAVYASSGTVLIILFSDTNYSLQGFEAEYSITSCPRNCSHRGLCVDGVCSCSERFAGEDCSLPLCPDNCGVSSERGKCAVVDGESRCVCQRGFVGDYCSLDDKNYVGNTWSIVSRSGPGRLSPRTGHAAVYDTDTDSLYVFGGFDLNTVNSDLLTYSFSDNRWTSLTSGKNRPSDRWSLNPENKENYSESESFDLPVFTLPPWSIINNSHSNSAMTTAKLNIVMRSRGDSSPEYGDDDAEDSEYLADAATATHITSPLSVASEDQESSSTPGSDLNSSVTSLQSDSGDKTASPLTLVKTAADRTASTGAAAADRTVSSGAAAADRTVSSEAAAAVKNRRSPMMRESRRFSDTTGGAGKPADIVFSNSGASPPALQGHTLVILPGGGGLVVYGGKLGDGTLSNTLWHFNITAKTWRVAARDSSLSPPPLWLHTMVLVGGGLGEEGEEKEEDYLYVFGGSSVGGRIENNLYRISSPVLERWEAVPVRGGKELDVRLTGHSCVYFRGTHSLLVFGGLVTDVPKFSKLSDKLFIFDLKFSVWSEIHYPRVISDAQHLPPETAFHTASLISNYMIIFGGYTHKHNRRETCYSDKLYFYHLECHTWVSHSAMEHQPPGAGYPLSHGLFGHAAITRNLSQLILVGGYHGVVSGDVISFTLPSTLSSKETPCHLYGLYNACAANPKCGWCGASGNCHRNIETFNCKGNLQVSGCPGLCSTLTDCHACTTHGSEKCLWCVESNKCYDRAGLYQCQKLLPYRPEPWWGSSKEISTPGACTTFDLRPGLTVTKYEHPANMSQPDYVGIQDSSKLIFSNPTLSGEREVKMAGKVQYTARLSGTIHPLRNPNSRINQLRVCVGQAAGYLAMSSIPPMSSLVEVLNMSTSSVARTPSCRPAIWPHTRLPISLYPSYAYSFHFTAERNLSNPQKFSLVSLQESNQIYGVESLEPFKNGSCSSRDNCLSCMEDSLCGWCGTSGECVSREADVPCPRLLTIVPEQCTNCSNHIHCSSCTLDPVCDWLLDEFRCVRRGRFPDGVSSLASCPAPCHLRDSCLSCLETRTNCVWCQDTQECFSFGVYTSEFQYGTCKIWRDSAAKSPEPLCSSCSDQTNCSQCIETFGCGWCYLADNPTIGHCTRGDFMQPAGGVCPDLFLNTTDLGITSSQLANITGSQLASITASQQAAEGGSTVGTLEWAYAECPDINECSLGLDECHPEATCTNLVNTKLGYTCTCNQGYMGDGFSSCNRTCYETCEHGTCSGYPDYTCICDVGWTGSNCSVDCGCNYHSTCSQGVGICDKCLHFTTGEACTECEAGTHGNASLLHGCTACRCNGHEDTNKGTCDTVTGDCFCLGHYEGSRCEVCSPGYFGDPTNGGECHHDCFAKAVITETQGILGAVRNLANPPRDCLWIISSRHNFSLSITSSPASPAASSHLDAPPLSPQDTPSPAKPVGDWPVIVLELGSSNMDIKCLDNYLYVYDGLPPFVDKESESRTIGRFCSEDFPPLSGGQTPLVARSGILSLYFAEDYLSGGFNASFRVMDCGLCPPGCQGAACDCDGYGVFPDCSPGGVPEVEECPNNCSAHLNQGVCDPVSVGCVCQSGYRGEDCSQRYLPHQIISTKLDQSDIRGVISRYGHTVVVDTNSVLWIFGGYNPDKGLLQDLRAFDTKTDKFKIVNIVPNSDKKAGAPAFPPPRYFHAAAFSPTTNAIFIHGGQGPETQFSDFWTFHVERLEWLEIEARHKKRSVRADMENQLNRKEEQPSLERVASMGHTLTHIPTTNSLILIGGYSDQKGLNEAVLEFDLVSSSWRTVEAGGYGPRGIYGHSASYSPQLGSLFVFGGVRFSGNATEVSSQLWSFHLATTTWSLLPFQPDHSKAMYKSLNRLGGRLFHSSVIALNNIVMIGGHQHSELPEADLPSFSLDCFTWLKIPTSHRESKYMRKQAEWRGEALYSGYGSTAALGYNGNIYILGGVRGTVQEHIAKVTLPNQMCHLFSRSQQDCLQLPGCDFCTPNNSSQTQEDASPRGTVCLSNVGVEKEGNVIACDTGVLEAGKHCDRKWNTQGEVACTNYRSCGECLSQWPVQDGPPVPSKCQWCEGCERGGKCVDLGVDCSENHCYSHQKSLVAPETCPDLECSTSNCDNCMREKCIWSNHFTRTSKQVVSYVEEGVTWNCEKRSLLAVMGKLNKTLEEDPQLPASCPTRCSAHLSCAACVAAGGGADAGAETCSWSSRLGRCISPVLKPALCLAGVCGKVISSDPGDCPVPCSQLTRCASCLEQARCGWCGHHSYNRRGKGVCAEGDVKDPYNSDCGELLLHHTTPTERRTSWHFSQCPPENECENGHHNCRAESEECIDTQNSFRCECSSGYEREEGVCVPVCSPPCLQGTCVAPDTCSCHFGFVGKSCQHQCQCHGNSDCQGPDGLDKCLDCRNNTTGAHCESCEKGFVGDPVNNVSCKPCTDFCSGHSEYCFNKALLLPLSSYNSSDSDSDEEYTSSYRSLDESDIADLLAASDIGPRQEAVCVNCRNNTQGERCQECIPDHFRAGSALSGEACRPCFCNHHSDQCNPLTGGDCSCGNHTETQPNVCNSKRGGADGKDNCWKLQCAKCKEFYIGDPTNGHQCFRSMVIEHDFCYDQTPGYECSGLPKYLEPGQAVFFAVQPRFMNVDIRITVDVTKGALDVLLTVESQIFLVNYNQSTGFHQISFDPQFGLDVNLGDYAPGNQQTVLNQRQKYSKPVFRDPIHGADRFKIRRNHPHLASNTTFFSASYFNPSNLLSSYSSHFLSASSSSSSLFSLASDFSSLSPGSGSTAGQPASASHLNHMRKDFGLREVVSEGMKTFVTLQNSQEVLFIRNVTDRLTVSVPESAHDLRASKFYLILQASTAEEMELSSGNIFFRQDQLHIDLFVFFSVFFSCFFLFLSGCVVFWKLKQLGDLRRARERQVIEMTIMARRPFASQCVLLQLGPDTFLHPPDTSFVRERRGKKWGHSVHPVGQNILPSADNTRLLPEPHISIGVRAITVEPTADGQAAVTSLLVQLPGKPIGLAVGCVMTARLLATKPGKAPAPAT